MQTEWNQFSHPSHSTHTITAFFCPNSIRHFFAEHTSSDPPCPSVPSSLLLCWRNRSVMLIGLVVLLGCFRVGCCVASEAAGGFVLLSWPSFCLWRFNVAWLASLRWHMLQTKALEPGKFCRVWDVLIFFRIRGSNCSYFVLICGPFSASLFF